MDEVKVSYAQAGEDIIIDFIFDTLQIKSRKYLDIGAHHPTYLSNTYYFYSKGFTGVSVEPDPVLHGHIQKIRPKDTNLQVGIGSKESSSSKFYVLDPPTLNTFSKHEAEMYKKYYPWVKIEKELEIKLLPVMDIIRRYFKDGIDILSVDTEGMDLEIIEAIDFNEIKPKVICAETAIYGGEKSLRKNIELIKHLENKGYFKYADTFVNTIFVDKETWNSNNGPDLEGF